MTRPANRVGDQTGAVLILALVLMLVWSTIALALLQFGVVGYELGAGSHERTDRIYASDSALETMVAALAADDDPSICGPVTLAFDGIAVNVDCTLYGGGAVRFADLSAVIGGNEQLRARVRFDGPGLPADVTVLNWTALR